MSFKCSCSELQGRKVLMDAVDGNYVSRTELLSPRSEKFDSVFEPL